MITIGIPVYKARDTLPYCLDALVAQTRKMFLVTLCQDCDGEDYSDIIETYRARGLHIRLISTPENSGPGVARQTIIDNETQSDYIMFCDSDDILQPRAVEQLYREAKVNNADIVRGSFIHEENFGPGHHLPVGAIPVTWCFTGETMVLTEDGYREIRELKIGDRVYSHDGTLQSIENIMTHKADNLVQTKISGALPVKVTDNHKFFIVNEKNEIVKKPIKEIEKKDRLQLFKLPERTKSISPKLAYVIGRYVGDGWKTKKKDGNGKIYYSFFLCCAKEEKDELEEHLREAGIQYGYHNQPHVQEFTLYKKNVELIHYLEDCGEGASTKHFPKDFLTWDNDTLQALFQGYFDADGCTIFRDGQLYQNKTMTVSKRLAYESSLVLRTLGYNPTYSFHAYEGKTQKILGKVCRRKNEYQVCWFDNEHQAKWVKQEQNFCTTYSLSYEKIEDDLVYNITVANNHSYVAGDFIVSNCHSVVYRLDYLRKNNIRFLPELRLNEDSYFNLVACNCTDKMYKLDEYFYIWRSNPNSLTRQDKGTFFQRSNGQYIYGQVKGLKKIYEIRGDIPAPVLCQTLINIYNAMMEQVYRKVDDYSYLDELLSLKQNSFIQDFLKDGNNWPYFVNNVKAACIYDNDVVYFYKLRFVDFITNYVMEDKK